MYNVYTKPYMPVSADSKNDILALEHWGGQSWVTRSLYFEYGYKAALAARRGCVVAIWSHSCCICAYM